LEISFVFQQFVVHIHIFQVNCVEQILQVQYTEFFYTGS